MARFLKSFTNNILTVFITDKVSYGMVFLESILGFNVQTQSPGSMIRFDVQVMEKCVGNTLAQCPGSQCT